MKSCCFLNNIRHGNHDPYTSYAQKYLTNLDGTLDTKTLRATPKYLLIYSYEDEEGKLDLKKDFLSSVLDPEFEANRERYLNASQHAFNILIIRDPFNFFASRLKRLDALPGVKDLQWIAHNWKLLAKEALDLNANPEPEKIVASYNRWAKDKLYREHLSETLLGTFDDSSMERVSPQGAGSSFDSMQYDRLTLGTIATKWTKLLNPQRYLNLGYYLKRIAAAPKAQEMKVMDRWKLFATDDTYRTIFADREILDLSEKLFGEIPGTREFVAGINSSPSLGKHSTTPAD